MAGVRIKIFTLPRCPNCPAAKALVEEVGREYGAEIEEVDLEKDPLTGLQYGIVSTPSIAVNEKIISRGEIPRKETLIEEIKRFL
jgi:small redox-active disulfide protein 1